MNLLLVFHRKDGIPKSTVDKIEKMWIDDREIWGIYARYELRKAQVMIMISPVNTPASGLLTPDNVFTAALNNDAAYE